MYLRAFISTSLWLALMGAVLFGAAGDLRWPEAWVYLWLVAVSSLVMIGWLGRHDPALLAARLAPPVHRDQKPWDRLFMVLFIPAFLGWMVLIGLDARRFGGSHIPVWLEATGAAGILLCMAVTWQTFAVNSFAAPQVRLHTDRAHRAVCEGPYRFVRHPMYSGALLFLFGMPLMLGSWWGIFAALFLAAGLAARAVGEERFLQRELAGYDVYMRQVRYRLIPGIW